MCCAVVKYVLTNVQAAELTCIAAALHSQRHGQANVATYQLLRAPRLTHASMQDAVAAVHKTEDKELVIVCCAAQMQQLLPRHLTPGR
jgi:hypothetical protein